MPASGSPSEKRLIVQILGSNPRLLDWELKMDVAKPFQRWLKTSTNVDLRAFVHEVRTFAADKESRETLENVRQFMEERHAKKETDKADKAAEAATGEF